MFYYARYHRGELVTTQSSIIIILNNVVIMYIASCFIVMTDMFCSQLFFMDSIYFAWFSWF